VGAGPSFRYQFVSDGIFNRGCPTLVSALFAETRVGTQVFLSRDYPDPKSKSTSPPSRKKREKGGATGFLQHPGNMVLFLVHALFFPVWPLGHPPAARRPCNNVFWRSSRQCFRQPHPNLAFLPTLTHFWR